MCLLLIDIGAALTVSLVPGNKLSHQRRHIKMNVSPLVEKFVSRRKVDRDTCVYLIDTGLLVWIHPDSVFQ